MSRQSPGVALTWGSRGKIFGHVTSRLNYLLKGRNGISTRRRRVQGFIDVLDAIVLCCPLVGYWHTLVSIQANVGTCEIPVARQLRLGGTIGPLIPLIMSFIAGIEAG